MAVRSWNLPTLVGMGLGYLVGGVLLLGNLIEARDAAGAVSPSPFAGGALWATLSFGSAFWLVLGLRFQDLRLTNRNLGIAPLASFAVAALHVFTLAAQVVLGPMRWALQNL